MLGWGLLALLFVGLWVVPVGRFLAACQKQPDDDAEPSSNQE